MLRFWETTDYALNMFFTPGHSIMKAYIVIFIIYTGL